MHFAPVHERPLDFREKAGRKDDSCNRVLEVFAGEEEVLAIALAHNDRDLRDVAGFSREQRISSLYLHAFLS
jgi:hypothetical protein